MMLRLAQVADLSQHPQQELGSQSKKAPTSWLRLYVASGTPNSMRAVQHLAAALERMRDVKREFDVSIIDVFQQSKRALTDGVIVTPTLVCLDQTARFVMIGDLSDTLKLDLFLSTFSNPQPDAIATSALK